MYAYFLKPRRVDFILTTMLQHIASYLPDAKHTVLIRKSTYLSLPDQMTESHPNLNLYLVVRKTPPAGIVIPDSNILRGKHIRLRHPCLTNEA